MNTQTIARERMMAHEAPASHLPAVHEPINVVPLPPGPKMFPPKIAKALLAIQKEFGVVEKSGWNDFHKYKYQKWEDVLNRVSTLLAQHELIIQQSEVARSLFENDQLMSITYAFTIINGDGDVWPEQPVWTAISRVRDSKGVTDDKAANKCHTQAHKYFLLHQFKIRTAETVADDSDGDTPSPKPQAPKPPDPNKPAAAADGPRTLPVTNATTFESFAADYIKAATTAKTPDEVKEWERLNEASLAKLEQRAPEVFTDLVDKVGQHVTGLIRAAKPAAPKPPDPNAKATPKPPDPNAKPDQGEDIPRDLLRHPGMIQEALIGEVLKADQADLDRLLMDKEFNAGLDKLDESGRGKVDLAFMQRRRQLAAKK